MPWVRVLLSCAIGDRLYPDPQWARLAAAWQEMYPSARIRPDLGATLDSLRTTMPAFVEVLVAHRPRRLHGRALGETLRSPHLRRTALLSRYHRWTVEPAAMDHAPPTLTFAVLGQARASGRLAPERESVLLRHAIHRWAVDSALQTARAAASPTVPMFVGQPTIWTDPPAHHQHVLTAL